MRSVKKNTFSNSTALKGLGGWLLEKGKGCAYPYEPI